MNDIITMSGDRWDEIAESIAYDPDSSMDLWLEKMFGFEFITYIPHPKINGQSVGRYKDYVGGYHLYKITNPALYTAFLLMYPKETNNEA
jgi:hypothetical protein